MVLTWSLSATEYERKRASSKAQYDFRLDEQDWEKVCWGRLPKGLARSRGHQLSRRAKWAAVLRAAASPEGGSWPADFQPEDMTPQRLQALARVIDREFFQGTFHREITRRVGRQLLYCSGDIDQEHGNVVPRGDAIMAAAVGAPAAAGSPPLPPHVGRCCATSAITASGAASSPAAREALGAVSLDPPRPSQAFQFRYRRRRHHLLRHEGATAAFPWEQQRLQAQEQERDWQRPGWSAPHQPSSASAPLAPGSPRSSSDVMVLRTSRGYGGVGDGGFVNGGTGSGDGAGDGGGGSCSDRGRWGWLRGLWRRCRPTPPGHGTSGGGRGGSGGGPDATGAGGCITKAAMGSIPSATYQHSKARVTLWRQVWAAHSPSVGNPVRLDGVVCVSRLSWLAHTLGHEMLHALLFNMCGAYARDAPRNLSMEGHGYNFLILNWYVLGHRGYTYNPRGWTLPPPLPCRL